MKFYMVEDKANGGWYKRADGKGGCGHWVDQDVASVWTTKAGATGAVASIRRYMKRSMCLMLPEDRAEWKTPEPTIVEIGIDRPLPKITLVRADDWKGLYLDGKLVDEGHRVDTIDVLHALGIEATQFWANDEWLSNLGSLPLDLKDVKNEDEKA